MFIMIKYYKPVIISNLRRKPKFCSKKPETTLREYPSIINVFLFLSPTIHLELDPIKNFTTPPLTNIQDFHFHLIVQPSARFSSFNFSIFYNKTDMKEKHFPLFSYTFFCQIILLLCVWFIHFLTFSALICEDMERGGREDETNFIYKPLYTHAKNETIKKTVKP